MPKLSSPRPTASRCTPPANRRGPTNPAQIPSRPPRGPPRTRTKSGRGLRHVHLALEHEHRRVADDRGLVPGEGLQDVHHRARKGPAGRALEHEHGIRGRRCSAARWRRSEAVKSRRSLLARPPTTMPFAPIARARVSVSASIRSPTTRIVPASPTSRPPERSSPSLPAAMWRRPRLGPPRAAIPWSARPFAWMTIAGTWAASRTMPVTGLSNDSVTSPPATRQEQRLQANSSSPSSVRVPGRRPRSRGRPGRAAPDRAGARRSGLRRPPVSPAPTRARSPGARGNVALRRVGRRSSRRALTRPRSAGTVVSEAPFVLITCRTPATAPPARRPAGRAAGRPDRAAAAGYRAGRRGGHRAHQPRRPRSAFRVRRA